ncbi:unnamed protein product [Alternaria alternata]
MGSCGSSLNCNKCYTNEPIDGCDTEIEINPDVAGLGVLISFLFGAFGLPFVVVWGYFNKCLPLDVLSCTDQYALQLLKKRRQPFVAADLRFEPTPKQKRRTQIIVGFITVLSDQHLVTGVAVLIAGLASRCRISFYEFNIVTYLAYFAAFTHALSLRVLQSHLFVRKLVRDYRVIFTIGFLVIFSFSFVINTVSTRFDDVVNKDSLNVGNVVQCLFEASRFGKTIQFDVVDSIVILGIVLFNHVTAIAKLYYEPDVDPLAMLLKSFYARGLRFRGFSSKDASTIVIKAESKYEAWLRPPSAITKDVSISVWFLLDSYYGSCLSVLPRIVLGMTYGTGSVILAVWYGGLKPANGLHVLGSGQIVAIVLLALTILAAVEVINGE